MRENYFQMTIRSHVGVLFKPTGIWQKLPNFLPWHPVINFHHCCSFSESPAISPVPDNSNLFHSRSMSAPDTQVECHKCWCPVLCRSPEHQQDVDSVLYYNIYPTNYSVSIHANPALWHLPRSNYIYLNKEYMRMDQISNVHHAP